MGSPADADARRSVRRFLTTDASLTLLLISLFALLFVLYPLVEPRTPIGYLLDILTLVVLVSGAYTVSDRRTVLFLCIGLAALTFVLQLLLYATPDCRLLLLRVASMMLFLAVVSGAVLYRVLRKGRVTAHRVGGAVAVYLMLGLIWASAYALVFIDDPASFDLDQPPEVAGQVSEIQTVEMGRPPEVAEDVCETQTVEMGRFVYFSFVTMTTLGYGDVTPKSHAAGNLAVLQALTGQIYLAVILARIVSLLVTGSDEE